MSKAIRQSSPAPWASRAGQINGRKPCLTVISGGPVGMLYTLPLEAGMLLGRGRDADVRLTNRRASRRHARIRVNPEGDAVVEDLGSTNGTFLNGKPVRRYLLKDGDKLSFGPNAVVRFSYQDEVERDFHQALINSEIKDPLTGIYTRSYIFDQIALTCAHAQRHATRLALLIFDIDRFNRINNMYGNTAGNFVVKTITRIVRRELRMDDIYARCGVDRFVVMARDISDAGAVMLARRIRRAIKSRKIVFRDTHIPASVSIGIATLSEKINEPTPLIRVAERYLRMAKTAGGACIAGDAVRGYRP
jgi:two-component system cell cycle response regulator